MGGSAAGARLALGRAGPRLARPMVVSDGYALPGLGGAVDAGAVPRATRATTEETLAAYDDAAARGAPRIVATTGGALAERARARRRAGRSRCRAASSRGRRSATRSWRRWRRRRWAAPRRRCAAEIEAAAALADVAGGRVGARRRRGHRGEVARARAARHRAGDRRRRARGRRGVPLEVPVQRERRAAGVRVGAAGGRSQRGRRLGGGAARSAGSPTCRWRIPGRIRATRCGPS